MLLMSTDFHLKCQKRLKFQQLYEETLTSQTVLNQEIADLKLTLQQTQQGTLFLHCNCNPHYFGMAGMISSQMLYAHSYM